MRQPHPDEVRRGGRWQPTAPTPIFATESSRSLNWKGWSACSSFAGEPSGLPFEAFPQGNSSAAWPMATLVRWGGLPASIDGSEHGSTPQAPPTGHPVRAKKRRPGADTQKLGKGPSVKPVGFGFCGEEHP